AAKLSKGGKEPGRQTAGRVTMKQVREVAEIKMKDLPATDLDAAAKVIAGSPRSMCLEVVEEGHGTRPIAYARRPRGTRPEPGLPRRRGDEAAQGTVVGEVRRDDRGRTQPGCRPASCRPDGARRLPAAHRFGTVGAGGGVRARRKGGRSHARRCRQKRGGRSGRGGGGRTHPLRPRD